MSLAGGAGGRGECGEDRAPGSCVRQAKAAGWALPSVPTSAEGDEVGVGCRGPRPSRQGWVPRVEGMQDK